MRIQFIALALLLASPSLHAARAQQSDSAEPIARVTLDPPRVVVGQRTTLRVEVLAPNYMTAPPELPGFQLRNAVTRQLQSININEQRDGVTYAGVRFEFAIYPQEPGSYVIADQGITVRYAAEPPATREATIPLPRIDFQAFIPDAAAELRPFLAANRLTIEQTVQRSSDQLKGGDAVTRTVTIRAEGTPAMLLPPVTFPAIDGLAVYAAQPSLHDKTVGRSDVMSASRVDSATYMLEKPGNYVLPAIDVHWWNSGENKIEAAHLDAVPLQVAANPDVASAVSASPTRWNRNGMVDVLAEHWLLALVAAAVLTLLGWFGPRLMRHIALHHRQRRDSWLQSESYFFERLLHAARSGDARTAYFALLTWLQRFDPAAPLHTVEWLMAAAHDPVLDREIDALQTTLFAPRRAAADWSPHQLVQRIGAARRTLQRHSMRSERTHALPRQLNPIGGGIAPSQRRRPPAR